MSSRPIWVTVPASSANLGPGFDSLGLALGLRAAVGSGSVPAGATRVDEHHPATVAYRRAGGSERLWVRSSIPMARGLGYSGAMRVAGAALGAAADRGAPYEDPLGSSGDTDAASDELRSTAEAIASDLEGHRDNAAASAHGGAVVTAGSWTIRLPLAVVPEIVIWIPPARTSTNQSRAALPVSVPFDDAVWNLARSSLLVAALMTGRIDALREATEDRLHQDRRLVAVDHASEVLAAGLEAGAWCGWLSGSGPTLAFATDDADTLVDRLAARVGDLGQLRALEVDLVGLRIESEEPAFTDELADPVGPG